MRVLQGENTYGLQRAWIHGIFYVCPDTELVAKGTTTVYEYDDSGYTLTWTTRRRGLGESFLTVLKVDGFSVRAVLPKNSM